MVLNWGAQVTLVSDDAQRMDTVTVVVCIGEVKAATIKGEGSDGSDECSVLAGRQRRSAMAVLGSGRQVFQLNRLSAWRKCLV